MAPDVWLLCGGILQTKTSELVVIWGRKYSPSAENFMKESYLKFVITTLSEQGSNECLLTHLFLDTMTAISQKIFSDAFS